jgi:hypothetical protein
LGFLNTTKPSWNGIFGNQNAIEPSEFSAFRKLNKIITNK